ncbi:hypothetical protein [Nocardia rhamnosiphila]
MSSLRPAVFAYLPNEELRATGVTVAALLPDAFSGVRGEHRVGAGALREMVEFAGDPAYMAVGG